MISMLIKEIPETKTIKIKDACDESTEYLFC